MTGSVGPTPGFHSVPHMNAIGYLIIAVLAIIFLPLLPFIAVIWFIGQKTGPEDAEVDMA